VPIKVDFKLCRYIFAVFAGLVLILVFPLDSRYGMSALMYAAREGHSTVVKKLIEVNGYMNRQDNKGYSVGSLFVVAYELSKYPGVHCTHCGIFEI